MVTKPLNLGESQAKCMYGKLRYPTLSRVAYWNCTCEVVRGSSLLPALLAAVLAGGGSPLSAGFLFVCVVFSFLFLVLLLFLVLCASFLVLMNVTVHRTMYRSSTSLLLRPLQLGPLRDLINQLIPFATCFETC